MESLDFTACLEALIVRSLNGTLSGADYDEDTWDESITQCPEGLTSYQSSPVPALRCIEARQNSYFQERQERLIQLAVSGRGMNQI